MPRFHYQASNTQGQLVTGHHQADEALHVRDYLRAQGLLPLEVKEVREAFWKKRWSLSERVVWMQQLAAALEARLPLLEALGMLVQQSAAGSASHEVSQSLYTAVQQGQPLDYGFRAFPQYFDRMTMTVVKSGLESGQLPTFLTDLAQHWEARQALRQKILAAALYPALVGGMSLIMTTGLLFFLTPTLESLFSKRWDQLPWITRFMVWVGQGLRNYGLWGIGVLCLAGIGVWKQLQKPSNQVKVQMWSLCIPGLGSLRVLLDSARLAHTLGILLSSGIPLLKALEVASPGVVLFSLRKSLEHVRDQVQQGGSLSRAMHQEGVFPPILVHWAESGERSGALADRLRHAAKQLQSEAERRLMLFTSILEPVLILGTGCVVLVLVLSILLPMSSIQQLVK